mmetsp:Transcript_112769/g.177428  ORF Transcript_112769/g.177428 Transcript_112769/m.177428 type:complete len:329 (-) Transcript_112769:20-1006(-)
MMAHRNATILLALVFQISLLTVEAAIVQTRQSSLRYQRIGAAPEQTDPGEREELTREDMLQQQQQQQQVAPQMVASMPPASMPALPQQMQMSQLQQMQQQQQQQLYQWEQLQQLQRAQQMQQAQGSQQQNLVGMSPPATLQAQQLIQAQALQLQQMQQQLQKQQQQLLRLQQQQQQVAQPQQQQHPQNAQNQESRQQQQQHQQTHQEQHVQQQAQALVGVGAKVTTKEDSSIGAGAIARPKGWDQCLKFARFVKSQDVTGMELIRVWKSTCEPAVESGRATERYKLMCNSLTGVIQPYSAQIDYDVEQLCDAVLAVFHDITAVDVKAR